MRISQLFDTAKSLWRMPRVAVNLQCHAARDNDPFFDRIVRQHYRDARRRTVRRVFLPEMVYGVATCCLPERFEDYYMSLESSARRNHKKAMREGCEFHRLDFNSNLQEIAEIRASATHRQGREMPASYLERRIEPINDPSSRNPTHGYPYFAVSLKGKLIGYAGCLIAGDYSGIEQIFGHADFLDYRVVPQLIIGIAQTLYAEHPAVHYYCYGTYFGATESMQRFKRKFGFLPHKVDWILGDVEPSVASQTERSKIIEPGKAKS